MMPPPDGMQLTEASAPPASATNGADPYRTTTVTLAAQPASLTFRWVKTVPRQTSVERVGMSLSVAMGVIIAIASRTPELMLAMCATAAIAVVWMTRGPRRSASTLAATQKQISVSHGAFSRLEALRVHTRHIRALAAVGAELLVETEHGTHTIACTETPAQAEYLRDRLEKFLGADRDAV